MRDEMQIAGRKRKPNVSRYPCGKARGEPEHVVKAVVWAYRAREVGDDDKDDPLAGFTLGRLRLIGRQDDPFGISQAQYDAGWSYAGIVRRHASIMGYSLGTPKSPGFELAANGTSVAPEPDEEIILKTRRQFSDCYRALMDAGRDIGQAMRVATVTYDVCLDRLHFPSLRPDVATLGNLKVGLNALARVLR